MSGFRDMIDDALGFFRALEANNNRDWFTEHKDRYTEDVKRPAELFIKLMEENLSQMIGEPLTGKLFRIHRDVRFSKDKTPYNTHLHMKWSSKAAGETAPVWFFGVAGSYARCGFGIMGLQGKRLTAYRALVDREGDALQEAIDATGGVLSEFGASLLKRVPKPYDADHPHEALLRRKSLIVELDVGKPLKPKKAEPLEVVTTAFERLLPLHGFLQENPV